MRRAKKHISAVTVLAILVVTCSCVATRRVAYINRTINTIRLEVHGFVAMPLTGEGPFPAWSDDLSVKFNPGVSFPDDGRRTYVAGSDFTCRHNKVESGSVVVDMTKQTVTVRVRYTREYRGSRLGGTYAIREDLR
jgi:hypothetical protein